MLLRLFLNLAELQLPTHDSQLTSHNSQKKIWNSGNYRETLERKMEFGRITLSWSVEDFSVTLLD